MRRALLLALAIASTAHADPMSCFKEDGNGHSVTIKKASGFYFNVGEGWFEFEVNGRTIPRQHVGKNPSNLCYSDPSGWHPTTWVSDDCKTAVQSEPGRNAVHFFVGKWHYHCHVGAGR